MASSSAASLTLRQLHFLVALADTGSFSRAAEACRVTQPTLSAAMKALEGQLGVRLAEREPRGIRLTQAGEDAVARARTILGEVDDFVSAIREAGEPLSGPFHLGAIPTIAPFVLPQLVGALKQAHPSLKLYLREDQTARLIDALRIRTLDAALIALPWDASGIDVLPLAEDEFLFVAPVGHPLATKPDLAPRDLDGQDLLLLEDGHCLRQHAIAACAADRRQGGTEVAATSLNTLVNMVAGGLGLSLLPRLAVDHGLTLGNDVALRPFAPPLYGRSIGIAWRAGSTREEEARVIGAAVKGLLVPDPGK